MKEKRCVQQANDTNNARLIKQFLGSNMPFDQLDEAALEKLFAISEKISIKKEEWLIKENTSADHLFLVYKGRVNILKSLKNEEGKPYLHKIASLGPGQTIGEMALVEGGVRSASAQASTDAILIALPLKPLHTLMHNDVDFHSVGFNVAKTLSRRLLHLDFTVVQSLQREIEGYRLRTALASFILVFISCLAGFMYVLHATITHMHFANTDTTLLDHTFSKALIIVLMVLSITYFVKQWGFSKKDLGFHCGDLKKNVLESIAISAFFMITLTLAKWCTIHYTHWLALNATLFFSWTPPPCLARQ